MSNASAVTRKVQEILRKLGKLDPGATGPSLENLLASNRRRRAAGKDPRGRKPLPPRLVIVGHSIFIRYLGEDHPTHIVLRAGMDPVEAEAAALVELDMFVENLNSKDRLEISYVDMSLREINDRYIAAKAGSSSYSTNKMRRRHADHLERFFPVKRLGDVVRGSGDGYIASVIDGAADEEKRKTLHNSAVERLRMQEEAIAYYYDSLTLPPDERRGYDIQKKFKRHSEITLTFDQFMRLVKAAEGWSYDLATGEWTEDYDPDLTVAGRYAEIYLHTGTRDKTILPLQWGVNLDGGCIDAADGTIYRKPPGAASTKKAARPSKLLGSLRDAVKKWQEEDFKNGWIYVLHDASGGEIMSMKSRFDRVKKKAGLEWMRAHDLKHTGVTLFGHAGLDISVIADAMSTRAQTLRDEYEHLDFLWIAPRSTSSVELDVSYERLAKTSPPSSEAWKVKAARWKASQEAQRARKKAKRRAKSGAGRTPVGADAAA